MRLRFVNRLYLRTIIKGWEPGWGRIELNPDEIDAVIGWIATISHQQPIYYLWRPLLSDPKDDMVLELAVAANAHYIVTFNRKDFGPAAQFGIKVVTPADFYRNLL